MRAVASIEELVRDPIGRYLLGEQSLVWCAHPRLAGTVVWGRAEEAEVRRVTRAWDYESRFEVPYDSVVDLQHLTGVDPGAFACVTENMMARLPRLAAAVRRQALVRPPGLPGAIVAGFYPTLQPGHAWSHFTDDTAAFAWLASPEATAAGEEVRQIVAQAREGRPLLGRVRQALRSGAISLAKVASELRVSPRALQRALEAAGSNFRSEVRQARVDRACGLLVDSDLKLEAVAKEVGCGSASAFVTFFRRATGESPGAYRERHRRG